MLSFWQSVFKLKTSPLFLFLHHEFLSISSMFCSAVFLPRPCIIPMTSLLLYSNYFNKGNMPLAFLTYVSFRTKILEFLWTSILPNLSPFNSILAFQFCVPFLLNHLTKFRNSTWCLSFLFTLCLAMRLALHYLK